MTNSKPSIQYAPEGDNGAGGASNAVVDFDPTKARSDAEALFSGADASGDDSPEVIVSEPSKKAADTKPQQSPKPDEKPAAKSFDVSSLLKKSSTPAPDQQKADTKPEVTQNPEDAITLSDKAKPETAKQFSAIKEITKSLRTELAASQAKIAELSNSSPAAQDNEEVTRLRAEHKAAMDRLAVVDLKSHPSFQKQYLQPKTEALARAAELLSENGISDVNVEALLSKPKEEFRKAINEIAGKLPSYDSTSFVSEVRAARDLQAKADAAVAQADSLRSNIQRTNTERARSDFDATWKTNEITANGGFARIEVDANAEPAEREFAEKYNASVDSLRAEAEKIVFNPLDNAQLTRVGIEAAAFRHTFSHVLPKVNAQMEEMRGIIKAQSETIKSLKGGKGAATVVNGGTDTSGAPKAMGEMSHAEAAAHIFSGVGAG